MIPPKLYKKTRRGSRGTNHPYTQIQRGLPQPALPSHPGIPLISGIPPILRYFISGVPPISSMYSTTVWLTSAIPAMVLSSSYCNLFCREIYDNLLPPTQPTFSSCVSPIKSRSSQLSISAIISSSLFDDVCRSPVFSLTNSSLVLFSFLLHCRSFIMLTISFVKGSDNFHATDFFCARLPYVASNFSGSAFLIRVGFKRGV